jgi:hypothetical protein
MSAHIIYLKNTHLKSFFGGRAGTPKDEDQTVCLQNIGPQQQRKRLLFGVQMLAFTLIVGVALIALGANHAWRLLLFFPFATAGTGFFQAWEKT